MYAIGTSPPSSSGSPMTATSWTAGCCNKRSSNSAGATYKYGYKFKYIYLIYSRNIIFQKSRKEYNLRRISQIFILRMTIYFFISISWRHYSDLISFVFDEFFESVGNHKHPAVFDIMTNITCNFKKFISTLIRTNILKLKILIRKKNVSIN